MALNPGDLSDGLEEWTATDMARELARRVALATSLSADAALPIVQAALAVNNNDPEQAVQQVSRQIADLTRATTRREAVQKLAETTSDLTKAALKTLEQSSRWTLLFIVITLGFLMIAAPFLLIMVNGRSATTTAEYLATSLIAGILTLGGLVGIIASDRGTRNATEAIHEKNADVVNELRSMLEG